MEQHQTFFLPYIMHALLLVQLRCTLSLVTIVISGRQERRMLLDAYSNGMPIARSLPSMLTRTPRSCWMRVRSADWWERVVKIEFSDNDWIEHFRMTRGSFDQLYGLMEGVLSPQEVTVRAPIPLPKRTAIVMYKLASCAEYRVVANQFGVHKATVKKFVYVLCKEMLSTIIYNLIKVPSAEEACAPARRFQQKFGIPKIMGKKESVNTTITTEITGCCNLVENHNN